jgi:hypothetical protein
MPEQHRPADGGGESARASCQFLELASYSRTLAKIGEGDIVTVATIRADVLAFGKAWRTSRPGEPLPRSFHYEELGKVAGHYRVSQIYVSRANYRVAILFIHSGNKAYLVDVFKKTKQQNKKKVDMALERAAKCWDALPSEEKEKGG